MPSVDFSVPTWLQPPSEAERARIDLARQAAAEKAGSMMTRAIGMRRMQAEANEAIKNGVDPVTARQNALLNNASLLFSDNPEAVSNMVNHQEAAQVREKANLQLNQHREMQDILKGQLNKMAQERLDFQVKSEAEKQSLNRDRLSSLDEARQERNQRELDKIAAAQEKADLAAKLRTSEEEGRNLRSQDAQKRLRQQSDTNSRIKIETMLQTDPVYGALVSKVTAAQQHADAMARRKGSKIPLWGTSQEDVNAANKDLQKAKQELNDYRAKVGKKFNVDMADTEDVPGVQTGDNNMPDSPTPAPSGNKRLRWTPEGLVPVQ